MLIKSKYSINKINYEKFGQQCFFGRDNIILKTVNLPKKHKYQSLCSKFKIKILIKQKKIPLKYFPLFS